jgi:hypothetical protein
VVPVTPLEALLHPHRLAQLVASVPATIGPRERARLDSHAGASEGCRQRVEALRRELDRALDGAAGPQRALGLACELDGLERVQQRLDDRLTTLVHELTGAAHVGDYHDGVPA